MEIELFKIKYVDIPNKIQTQLKEWKVIHIFGRNLLEVKNEILRDYTGEFQMVGKLSIGDHFRETHTRFRNITDYQHYLNSIDEGYDTEDAIFNGYIYKINTPQFSLVNKRQ